MFCKINVLQNFTKFTGKHLCWSLVFNKVEKKKVFSCEFCELFLNTFFTEHLWVTASVLSCAIINLLGFFDVMFSIFELGSRFNSGVNVGEVP